MEEDPKNNKYTNLGIGAVILVILVIYAFSRQTEKNGDDLAEKNTLPETATSTSNIDTNTTSTKSIPVVETKKTIVPPKTQPKITGSASTYQKAIETYQYRFQFLNCQGNPGKLTMKEFSKVMLDNRDANTHVFGFGGAKYTVKGYSFVIVTAPKVGTHFVTCDGGGAAQMITQK